MINLPFSERTTSSVAVFATIFIASPQGAQTLSPTIAQTSALALEYAELINIYPVLIHQDVANQKVVLVAAITTAITIVTSLVATLNSMSTAGDNLFILEHYQTAANNALENLKAAMVVSDSGE